MNRTTDNLCIIRNKVDHKGEVIFEEFFLNFNITEFTVSEMMELMVNQILPVLGYSLSEERKMEILDDI